jgi:hypothetical protein
VLICINSCSLIVSLTDAGATYVQKNIAQIFSGSLLTKYKSKLEEARRGQVPKSLESKKAFVDLSQEGPNITGLALEVWKLQQQRDEAVSEVRALF